MWETPLNGLRVGGSFQALRLDTTLLVPAVGGVGGGATVDYNILALIWVASMEYTAHRVLIAAEYSRWHLSTTSDNTLIAPATSATQERSYIMGAYRVNRWFQPSLYYSAYLPNAYKRYGRANVPAGHCRRRCASTSAPFWIIKLEGHFMDGTAALDPTLNSNKSLAALDPYWGFFLVKTTVYF